MIFNCSVKTDEGKKRKINEDGVSSTVKDDVMFLVICDGFGIDDNSEGIPSGKLVAAQIKFFIEKHFNEQVDIKNFLEELTTVGNNIIEAFKSSNPKLYSNYGCSLTVCAIKKNYEMTFCNLGINRLYLIRGNNIFQGTEDDNAAYKLLKEGEINEVEYETHEQRTILTNGLGYSADITPYIQTILLEPNDFVILLTDGIYRLLGDNRILNLVNNAGELNKASEWLIDGANELGGLDNLSAIISYIE